MRGLPNLRRTVRGVAAKTFFAHSHEEIAHFSRGGDVSGRISIPICIAAAAALLVSGIGTDLQATTRANDCLTAPNASSPRGQHWYYHVDLPSNRKCWYLHAPLTHRAAKASESHAVSTTADAPVSGSRADSAPRLPHSRILSLKPQPSFVSAKSIQRNDPPLVPQEHVPQANALRVDASKPTDAVAASSPAAAKPIEQGDALSVPQENIPQGSTLQVDGFKPTDTVATSSPAAAKPIEQSDAPSIPQQHDLQGSTRQFDGFKPTDTVATSSPAAAKPIEQSVAPSIPQQNDGPKPTDADVATSPATPTFRVAAAGADSAPSDMDAGPFGDGRRIAERSTLTTQAGIVGTLSFTPVQIFLLLMSGLASVVFLISLVILLHHRVAALVEFRLDHDRPEARAQHGWQGDRADARSSQMFVDNGRGQDGIDAPPWRVRPSATRPQIGNASSTEPPRSSVEDVKAALEDLKAALIYEDRTRRFRQGSESSMAP